MGAMPTPSRGSMSPPRASLGPHDRRLQLVEQLFYRRGLAAVQCRAAEPHAVVDIDHAASQLSGGLSVGRVGQNRGRGLGELELRLSRAANEPARASNFSKRR